MKITKHCKRRLKKRGITQTEVKEAVNNGQYHWIYYKKPAKVIKASLRVRIKYKDLTIIKHGNSIITAWRRK